MGWNPDGYQPDGGQPPGWQPGDGADVTLGLTGQSATAAQGSMAPSVAAALSGQAATASAGSVAQAVSVALAGLSATASPGSIVAAIAKALTGQAATMGHGTITVGGGAAGWQPDGWQPDGWQPPGWQPGAGADVTLGLTGQSMNVSQGALAYSAALQLVGSALAATQGFITSGSDVTVMLTGQSLAAALGTLSPAHASALTGSEATAAAGTMTIQRASALSGQASTLSVGTIAAVRALALLGIPCTVSQGTVTFQEGQDVTVNLTGLVLALTAGNLSPEAVVALAGIGTDVAAGSIYALTPPAGGSTAPFPSVEGQVAAPNPVTIVPNPLEGTTVAGENGCILGRFGRMNESGEVWNGRRGDHETIGFVLAWPGTWGSVYWTNGRPVLRAGLPITLAAAGSFWARFGSGAIPGARVYARLVDGAAVSGYAAGCEPTPWYVVTQAAAGELAVISTTSRVQ